MSFARILTKGENPVIKNIVSFQSNSYANSQTSCPMLHPINGIQKYHVQICVKGKKDIPNKIKISTFFSIFSTNILHIHHMTLRATERLRKIGTEDYAYIGTLIQREM